MKIPQSGMDIGNPAWAILMADITYWGVTTADGNAGGTTLVCGGLALEPSYANHSVKILSGPSAGQVRDITTHPAGTDTGTVSAAFSNVTGAAQQITAGTLFVILSSSPTVAEVADIRTSQLRQLFSMDFWSLPQEEVQLTAAAGDKAFPDITVADLPAGATIVRAYLMFKFRMIENTNVAANKLNAAQEIQVRDDGGGAWTDAINFVDDMFGIAASTRESGDVIIGAIDVAGAGFVDGNDTYNVQWDEAVADLANLQFNDVQVGLRIWYSV
jgi:hypothetical protein